MDELSEWRRSKYCGEVTEADVGRSMIFMGWVDRVRDMGSLIFIDLRDREGQIQVVAGAENAVLHEKFKRVRPEFVVAVSGELVRRSEDTVNPEISTGRVELKARELRILNAAQTPPFPIGDRQATSEETRLRHRYLDLRGYRMQRNLRLRHQVALAVRRYLDRRGFLEIETPFLTKSTPEGARDYLVPSRLYPGQFYALPQSPQLFKQILMVAGLDKYFQIVRCFRDEDLRADRQPEFTQIDIELSFARPKDVFELVEGLLGEAFQAAGLEVQPPFPRLGHRECLERFGTDRPDLRFGMELIDFSADFQDTPFEVFREILAKSGRIMGIRVPGQAERSRRELEDLAEVVRPFGLPALTWVRVSSEGVRSSLPKVVDPAMLKSVAEKAGLQNGDVLLLGAGPARVVQEGLGALRIHQGRNLNLIQNGFQFLWVEDFPLLEWDEGERRYFACHHPFTSPREEDLERLESDPASVRAKAYDVVLNGVELGGGSIRIHRPEVQDRVFRTLGIGPQEAEAKFGFFLEALKYGAPPHGGIALGLDRLVMILAGERSLREVIAFPKTARAVDLMSGSPSTVSPAQLRELHLQLRGEDV